MSVPRLRIPRESDFTSHLRSPAVAARVGVALGSCFAIAFLTGLVSHWAQDPHPWFFVPTRPSWGYRVTQGVHVAVGTAAVPLLLVKLWTVFPRLFTALPSPTRRARFVLHGLERASIAVLVAAALFQLATGLVNTTEWYPWAFTFRRTHDAVGWVAVGSLLVHVAVKLPVIRRALGADVTSAGADRPETARVPAGLSRRGLLRATWLASGIAVLGTAGATVPALRKVSLFATHSGAGPMGVPVTKSARAAGVVSAALDPGFTLTVSGPGGEVALGPGDLLGLSAHDSRLPIACVEGWSASGTWRGPRISDLLAMVGAPARSAVRVTSAQQDGPFRVTTLPPSYAADPATLLATHLNGHRLAIDHGFPCRVIAPNRPGVLQTKWVTRLEVL